MSEQTKLRNRILGLFVHAGENGKTDAEIALALGASKNVVPCRRRDLELNGLVRKTDQFRSTDTGATASVYVVTQAGIANHNSPEDAPSRPRRKTFTTEEQAAELARKLLGFVDSGHFDQTCLDLDELRDSLNDLIDALEPAAVA